MVDYLGITILLGSFILLLILRTPISFALLTSAILTSFYLKVPLMSVAVQMVKGIHSFSLLAIPFFILAGEIMGAGGISRRIIEFTNVLVGRVRGGLAQVNILASMFFGGISGSAIADVSSIGALLIPMMKDSGYDTDYAVDVTITSACQGLIIPPSHNMIIFAVSAGGVSVGQLFLGGMLPGVLLGMALMIISYVIAVKRGYPKGAKISFKEAIKIASSAILGLLTAVIIIGGVIGGIFTATESAAVACVYAFLISVFVYKELKLKDIYEIFKKSAVSSAVVLFVVSMSAPFGWFMTHENMPTAIASSVLGMFDNKIILLLMINVILLFLGCFLETQSIILLVTPILVPIAASLGMSAVALGIIIIINTSIGMITPPMAVNLFVASGIANVSIGRISKRILLYLGVEIAALLVMTFIPGIITWLPTVLGA